MSEAAPSSAQPALPEPPPAFPISARLPYAGLRSVQWRVNLGVLPCSPSSSVDELRRFAADSRRRYANLRRRLLVDPKDGKDSSNLIIDNPLSQNPDSSWGRFFRNAELEKMVDQDLTRLYPEHGSYFQTAGFQGILRRILLLWSLRHSEYGYRQGMHELLAPLLYVLQVDLEYLSQVRKKYEDQFIDKFDELSSDENDLYHFDVRRSTDTDATNAGSQGSTMKMRSLDEVDPDIKRIVLLTDAYGAEGELGILLSEKFVEHDAYSMFDALMSGGDGLLAMAEFFSHSPVNRSNSGLPPVIEGSAALYHLLSIVDSSLHSHLTELGVEPQYFALRWLRVLFGREFVLRDLLVIWDEIFMFGNNKLEDISDDDGVSFKLLGSPRGAFIAALAVSMILLLRSSLLATEHATACLQRLLNFPEDISVHRVIEKAKSLHELALVSRISNSAFPLSDTYDKTRSMAVRTRRLSFDSASPKTLGVVPDSYWEEKWRVMQKTEELKKGDSGKEVSTKKKGWPHRLRLSLSRAQSDPSSAKLEKTNEENETSIGQNRHDDCSRPHGSIEVEDINCQRNSSEKGQNQNFVEVDANRENGCKVSIPTSEGYLRNAESGESSPLFSGSASPLNPAFGHENETDRSSVASNDSTDEQDHFHQYAGETLLPVTNNGNAPDSIEKTGDLLPISNAYAPTEPGLNCDSVGKIDDFPGKVNASAPTEYVINCDSTGKAVVLHPTENCGVPVISDPSSEFTRKAATVSKERKPLSGKLQWLRKLGRNSPSELQTEKGGSSCDTSNSSEVDSKGDKVSDQDVMCTLKNLGQSMTEHIQVVESAFQQERDQAGSLEKNSKRALMGKEQITALEALKELRKISILISEM